MGSAVSDDKGLGLIAERYMAEAEIGAVRRSTMMAPADEVDCYKAG